MLGPGPKVAAAAAAVRAEIDLHSEGKVSEPVRLNLALFAQDPTQEKTINENFKAYSDALNLKKGEKINLQLKATPSMGDH